MSSQSVPHSIEIAVLPFVDKDHVLLVRQQNEKEKGDFYGLLKLNALGGEPTPRIAIQGTLEILGYSAVIQPLFRLKFSHGDVEAFTARYMKQLYCPLPNQIESNEIRISPFKEVLSDVLHDESKDPLLTLAVSRYATIHGIHL